MVEINDELFCDIKNHLDITWDDADGDKKLKSMILRGMNVINDRCGAEYDYNNEGMPKELLINYVMYARSSAVDEFLQHYASELLRLQLINEMEAYSEKT